MVKNKSNVVKRGLYSCRQRYAALQWSKCCATNWATSPSARFALVIEYVSSIHPWANSRCWISQSERALCFSYVINFLWRWYCGRKQIEMWFIVVCTLVDNKYASLLFSQTLFRIVSARWAASLRKFFKGKSDAYVQVAHLHNAARVLSSPSRCFQLSTNLDKDFCRYVLTW